MNRGSFSFFLSNQLYKDSDKHWVVELDKYHRYWYDLIVNPNEVADYFDTRELIVNHLKKIKKDVEESLEKRFVYFICTRERVRFNTNKKVSYNPLTKKVKIPLLIGEQNRKISVKCSFIDQSTNKPFRPVVMLTDKYITLKNNQGLLTTISIHDFLEDAKISLGLDSRVEYVGYTKNPHSRPTNGSHTGLSDVLYKVSHEKRDSLIYFNVFKTFAYAESSEKNVNFAISNSMINEIDADLEGNLIEKCFILYFDSKNQSRNKANEYSELESNLMKISGENRIKSIYINYEMEEANEYGRFSSSQVPASDRHSFTVLRDQAGLNIINGTRSFDDFFN